MNASDSRPAHANTAERRTILDAIPAIAWCKLPDGSNEFVNRRWQDCTGIPADEARGQGWQAAVSSSSSRVRLPSSSALATSVIATSGDRAVEGPVDGWAQFGHS